MQAILTSLLSVCHQTNHFSYPNHVTTHYAQPYGNPNTSRDVISEQDFGEA